MDNMLSVSGTFQANAQINKENNYGTLGIAIFFHCNQVHGSVHVTADKCTN
jgi:hypothetical protein